MDEKLEVILECDTDSVPSELCRVKYSLPLIGCVAVETDKTGLEKLKELREIKAVHRLPYITAQMHKARSIIGCDGLKYKGNGIAIAFLDTGISPVEDFEDRITAFKDFINKKNIPYDDNGHGTHVAGIACGSGALSKGKYKGIATEANIIALKVLNKEGKGNAGDILAGLQWIYDNKDRYNIRLVNLSIGTPPPLNGRDDPLVRAAEALWDSGICVVCASGNNGPAPCSVSSPGTSKKIITVGSSDDENETTIQGMSLKNYSGRGPTLDCIIKPDVVAPGSDIISCLAPESVPDNSRRGYRVLSGTSMSTPMVTGSVALLLEKYPSLTPDDIKYMLKLSSKTLGYPQNRQGWGLLSTVDLLGKEPCNIKEQFK